MKREFIVLGGMAGSSMDGLDLALLKLFVENTKWHFQIMKCETIEYPTDLYARLKTAPSQSTEDQKNLDDIFGSWIAQKIKTFLQHTKTPELFAIHGHTVMHTPDKKISWQLGNGQLIADLTKILTISDFRSLDIELGGQGAPLVPFGDFNLFDKYDACLNLGGIANISIQSSRLAGDICPCNQVLNHYARQLGLPFDASGNQSKEGSIDHVFLKQIEEIPFFAKPFPKSLANDSIPQSLLDKVKPKVGLRSYTEFIANQVAFSLQNVKANDAKLLITGGGAFNSFLVSRIKASLPDWKIVTPDADLISFKEAIIFAFLGLMRIQNEINVLSTVTGASRDSSSGVIHLPK